MRDIILRATRAHPYTAGPRAGPNAVEIFQEAWRKDYQPGDRVTVLTFKREMIDLSEFEKRCELERNDENHVSLSRDAAQALIDDLWDCGLRPTRGDTGGVVDALKYHLEDLRTLVFKK